MNDFTALDPLSRSWMTESVRQRYSYGFRWLGLPIIQYPQDIVAIQELIWAIKPDLIIETGIAHGGSLVLSASILQLLGGNGLVAGIDIDIRPHNRQALEAHPLFHRIRLFEGSALDSDIVTEMRALAQTRQTVMVLLDSMHTHQHVLEDLPPGYYRDHPRDVGNNLQITVPEFLCENSRFERDLFCNKNLSFIS